MQASEMFKFRRLRWLGALAMAVMLCGLLVGGAVAAQMQSLEIVGKTGVHVCLASLNALAKSKLRQSARFWHRGPSRGGLGGSV